jgi:DNA-binding transcriptional ArsR family regulator
MLRATVELLKTLAEPTRLRLLYLLHRFGTICVCDLMEITQLPQYHISRHLATLRKMGLVVDFRDGTRMNYQLAGDAALVLDLLTTLGPALEEEQIIQADTARAREVLARRRGEKAAIAA